MPKIEEIFLPIKDYEGFYEISNHGRIKSLNRIDCKGQYRKERILKNTQDKDGYLVVELCKDRRGIQRFVHRLVAIHFIPNPENLSQVNHKLGNKKDNYFENIEWCSTQYNIAHAQKIGLRDSAGDKNAASILTSEQVMEIFNSPDSNKYLANKFNIGALQIGRIKSGYNWSCVTGKKYKQHVASNLPSDKVLDIFKDVSPKHEIAQKHSVQIYIVESIKRGQTYSKITGKNHVVTPRAKNYPAPTVVGAGLN